VSPMLALSIRQPWAWLILHGGKDVENRTWATRFRGRFLIHAAKGCTRREFEEACAFARLAGFVGEIPDLADLPRGGIVGSVLLSGCANHSASPWFVGPLCFNLEDPEPVAFLPCRGSLGFFRPVLPGGAAVVNNTPGDDAIMSGGSE